VTADESRAEGRKPPPPRASERSRRGRKQTGEGRRQGEEEEQADPWEVALRLLAGRARSCEEIRLSLGRLGYSPEAVAAVLGRLAAARYVNDLEFARDWVRARAERSGFGPARLTRELRAKGIGGGDIRTALGELLAEQGPLALAEQAARRKLTALQGVPPAVGRRRLAAYLTRRGFSTEIVLRLSRKSFPDIEESCEMP
jgi:regulatory protein